MEPCLTLLQDLGGPFKRDMLRQLEFDNRLIRKKLRKLERVGLEVDNFEGLDADLLLFEKFRNEFILGSSRAYEDWKGDYLSVFFRLQYVLNDAIIHAHSKGGEK